MQRTFITNLLRTWRVINVLSVVNRPVMNGSVMNRTVLNGHHPGHERLTIR